MSSCESSFFTLHSSLTKYVFYISVCQTTSPLWHSSCKYPWASSGKQRQAMASTCSDSPSSFSSSLCLPWISWKGSSRVFVKVPLGLCPSNSEPKSCEILMFVCLQKDAKQCCDATKNDRTHCVGQQPAQWVLSRFVASQHCLASFWRQTNIKISPDLVTLY